MALPVVRGPGRPFGDPLKIDAEMVADWLLKFLREECIGRRSTEKAVLGLSGGLDSAVVAYLCARALGRENVFAFRMPYALSSADSLRHAQLVVDALGINERTIDITSMVDGYRSPSEPEMSPARLGNVCARCRMIVLFDQSAKLGALPIGTGNKTERLFGYFTWHGDDAPPINPLGDLFKVQVRELAGHLGVPREIVEKPPTADLIQGQTDEGDFGISYDRADPILHYMIQGYSDEQLVRQGFSEGEVRIVRTRLDGTHWKRRPPTVAVLSGSAIGESYLRPVDY
jgi:NAD+ synthetase